jgi:hypothetical protein
VFAIPFAGLVVGGPDEWGWYGLLGSVDLDKRVRADHPLRVIRGIVNATLATLSGEFDLLFRWFVGTGVDDPVWDATTFSKNRGRPPNQRRDVG